MSVMPERRSQVTLQIGGALGSGERAALIQQLLERGLEVACRNHFRKGLPRPQA